MLIGHLKYLCIGIPLFMLLCAAYAYRVNERRAADDSKKRNYLPGAIFLAPITWPLLLFASISLFILRALVYGLFLILFTFALVAIRKPFILTWLDKVFTRIGNRLLAANTWLIKLVFGDQKQDNQTA